MKVFFLSITLLTACYSLLATSAFSQTSQPIYGGGQMFVSTGNIAIDKKVAHPQSQPMWVDNLTINDSKYKPDNTINFQINISNTGDTEIKSSQVKDIFPQYVNFTSGPGSFDANTKTLTFEVNNLSPKESRTFLVVGKVASANQLPIDVGSICMVNQVTATVSGDAGMSQDNALFCLEKEVLGKQDKGGFPVFPPEDISTTPATGPASLILFSLIPLGATGFFLRKHSINSMLKSKKNKTT